jgi:hypothetical protein
MKANELRIGNLVYHNHGLGIELPAEITDGKDINMFHQFEPIPLTKEWLFKFGFYIDGVWVDMIKRIDHNKSIGIDIKTKHVFISYIDSNSGFRDVNIIKCEYVHQLQNLYFALTNEELKII